MKTILCWFGFHDWKTIERIHTKWVLQDNEEMTEVVLQCSRCKKEGRIMHLILKQ